ncbi:MAG TPA: helix-turn-helix transcriptional regulator [Solirubrobacteraceae bacterium]|nr:helix-turn-helix transcriptional regulator [Solirubrobacteraceae bacterium]
MTGLPVSSSASPGEVNGHAPAAPVISQQLKAADVGLPDYGTRRVPGLRREDVAVLAGVSVPYYTRLERGDLAGASDSVLEALARALRLDDAERAHLLDLARAAQPIGPPRRRRPTKHRIRPSAERADVLVAPATAVHLHVEGLSALDDRHQLVLLSARHASTSESRNLRLPSGVVNEGSGRTPRGRV